MERLILIFIIIISAIQITFAESKSVSIKVKKVIVYGTEITDPFEGTLEEFTSSKFFGPEYTEGELEIVFHDKTSYLKNAKNLARYAWKHLTDNVTVTAPYPCGLYYQGTLEETFIKNEEGIFTEYTIIGEGDGSFDSCNGNGGPGWWSYQVKVNIDPITSIGNIKFNMKEE